MAYSDTRYETVQTVAIPLEIDLASATDQFLWESPTAITITDIQFYVTTELDTTGTPKIEIQNSDNDTLAYVTFADEDTGRKEGTVSSDADVDAAEEIAIKVSTAATTDGHGYLVFSYTERWT